jgi:hypothetical protein
LITQSEHVQQHAQGFETGAQVIFRDALRVSPKGVMTFQTCIALRRDVRVAEIADRLMTMGLMQFEVRPCALALGFGMPAGTACRYGNGIRVKFRDANGEVHRALQKEG